MTRTDEEGASCRTCGPSSCLVRNALMLTLMLTIVGGFSAFGTTPVDNHSHGQCVVFDHSHAAWTDLLQDYVRDGRVDYAGLKKNGQAALDSYLNHLSGVCAGFYARFDEQQRIAFWLNAYNAYMVRLILDNYPLGSVREIGWLPLAAFRNSFIPIRVTGESSMSLNDIEHDILRKECDEPRVHFAMVCASRGCPDLRSEAYRATDLDEQLDDQARRFINDPSKNRYVSESRTLELSSIFKWFRADFERGGGQLTDYVGRYSDDSEYRTGKTDGIDVTFLDYDWSLNSI